MKKKKNLFDLALDLPDLDGDGVPDWKDCVPNDPDRQHHPSWRGVVTTPSIRNIKKPRSITYKGFDVDDYIFSSGEGYVLRSNAKPAKKRVFRKKRRN